MKEKIIQIGAEASIILRNNTIVKRRERKLYRHSDIDKKITTSRTRSESKLIEKASKLIDVPKIIKTGIEKNEIILEFLKGKKLSEFLNKFTLNKQKQICEIIGKNIAKLHDSDIIHGDLTTSNMIYLEKEKKVYFIDFGLGFISSKIEDKTVDLHLLRQALEARHFKNWKLLFEEILKGYSYSENSEKILVHLKRVEVRGRYKKQH